MAKPEVYTNEVDRNEIYVFDMEFSDDNDVPTDVSDWEFNFTLKTSLGDIVWEVTNAEFTRPTIYSIYFEKTQAEVEAVNVGNYNISLLVTKPNNEWVNNEILKGTWAFK
ncbi:MAG: hypothetical protein IPJ81_06805 [Chitinophagaceae bacterium]|nr:hypothetical protein [Chitinophagaceae bacterium]